MRTLLYIHGFRSVGLCIKGRKIASFAPNALTPDLPYVPKLAIALLESIILEKGVDNLCLIGSSLGGFYAIFLAQKYGIKTILINPVIDGYKTLLPAIGKVNVTYNGEAFFWSLDLVESLKAYNVQEISPKLYCVLLQKGDKVLDYRVAAQKFKDSKCIIQEGGSHRFENFSALKSEILQWANS